MNPLAYFALTVLFAIGANCYETKYISLQDSGQLPCVKTNPVTHVLLVRWVKTNENPPVPETDVAFWNLAEIKPNITENYDINSNLSLIINEAESKNQGLFFCYIVYDSSPVSQHYIRLIVQEPVLPSTISTSVGYCPTDDIPTEISPPEIPHTTQGIIVTVAVFIPLIIVSPVLYVCIFKCKRRFRGTKTDVPVNNPLMSSTGSQAPHTGSSTPLTGLKPSDSCSTDSGLSTLVSEISSTGSQSLRRGSSTPLTELKPSDGCSSDSGLNSLVSEMSSTCSQAPNRGSSTPLSDWRCSAVSGCGILVSISEDLPRGTELPFCDDDTSYKPVSDDLLLEIARNMDESHVSHLGLALGFTYKTMLLHTHENRLGGNEGTVKMLLHWKARRKPTVSNLREVLMKTGLVGLGERILPKDTESSELSND